MRKAGIILALSVLVFLAGIPASHGGNGNRYQLGLDLRCKPLRAVGASRSGIQNQDLILDIRTDAAVINEVGKRAYLRDQIAPAGTAAVHATAMLGKINTGVYAAVLNAAVTGTLNSRNLALSTGGNHNFFAAVPLPKSLSVTGQSRSGKRVVSLILGKHKRGQSYSCESRRSAICIDPATGAVCGKFTQAKTL